LTGRRFAEQELYLILAKVRFHYTTNDRFSDASHTYTHARTYTCMDGRTHANKIKKL